MCHLMSFLGPPTPCGRWPLGLEGRFSGPPASGQGDELGKGSEKDIGAGTDAHVQEHVQGHVQGQVREAIREAIEETAEEALRLILRQAA